MCDARHVKCGVMCGMHAVRGVQSVLCGMGHVVCDMRRVAYIIRRVAFDYVRM